MSRYILAIDQGTTGSTVTILDQHGGLVAKVNQEYPQIFPKPGWVEHNPNDIWNSVRHTIDKALQNAKVQGHQIAAIGITNQRETVVLWDKETQKPVYNAIVWQCRRTQDFCEQLKRGGHANNIRKKTGLVIDPYFSGTKIRWILKNVPSVLSKAKEGKIAAGTIDTFLIWQLTGGVSHKTDVSNASRTMLMDINKGQWDGELCKLLQVPVNILPEICPSAANFGVTRGLGFLPDGIPITGVAGDQQAALFGQTCFAAGEAKCTFGTGSFLLMNTGHKKVTSKSQLLTTVAWQLPKAKMVYALEGGAFVCGAAVQWLRDGLGIISRSAEVESLANQVLDCGGVEFVPALTGLGAPHWKPEARGAIVGLTRGTTKSHIARATLEAMALQNVDILNAMQKDLGKKIKSLKVDGGAVANNLLMQMQADFLGAQIIRPQLIESTSLGAAYLAGIGIGMWADQNEIKKIWKVDRSFDSKLSSKARGLRLSSWHKAVKKSF